MAVPAIKLIITASLVAITSLASSSSARAAWQYTRWGMSEQEVLAASAGKAYKPAAPDLYPDGGLHLLSAPHEASGLSFEARFVFDAQEGLERIRLDYPLAECGSLSGPMTSTYGSAEVKSGGYGKLYKWRDEANGNLVMLSDFPNIMCGIIYSPLPRAGEAGGL